MDAVEILTMPDMVKSFSSWGRTLPWGRQILWWGRGCSEDRRTEAGASKIMPRDSTGGKMFVVAPLFGIAPTE